VHEAEEIAEETTGDDAAEAVSDAAVEIARIEARRDIKVEEIRADTARDALAEVDALRQEFADFRAMQPPPEPVIVEVPAPDVEVPSDVLDELDVLDAPGPDEGDGTPPPSEPKTKKKKNAWWD
jgi:hypothetical protein